LLGDFLRSFNQLFEGYDQKPELSLTKDKIKSFSEKIAHIKSEKIFDLIIILLNVLFERNHIPSQSQFIINVILDKKKQFEENIKKILMKKKIKNPNRAMQRKLGARLR